MLRLNRFLFYEICQKDLTMYEDIIQSFQIDYRDTIRELANATTCESVRFYTHKLVGVISILKDSNCELLYLCKSILNLPKDTTDFTSYKYFIDQLVSFDTNRIGI
jgi:hypothetical protein